MKKIIGGKKYDTETAKFCGEYTYSNARDFNHFGERLYQKKNCEFFLYGEGGATSKYGRSCGQNEWCGSEQIIPLSENEARDWAEKYLDVEEYISLFGEPEE